MIQILQLIVPLLIAQILYESDSDSESSGLNFESLPVQLNTLSNIKKKAPIPKLIYTHYTLQIPLFSFPWSLCKESNHDSKCCTLCDEWVHRKCTDLTIDQSKTHCSPDHYYRSIQNTLLSRPLWRRILLCQLSFWHLH